MTNFYVYVIKCPDTYEPRYVGKGTGDRYLHHYKFCDVKYYKNYSNKLVKQWLRTLKAEGKFPVYDIQENLTESAAFDLETQLIKQYGKKIDGTGTLLNVMEGGLGGRQPDLVIKQISETLLSRKSGRPVTQYTLSGDLIQTFYSVSEAARKLDVDPSAIVMCCRGKGKSAGGYRWSYENHSLPTPHKNRKPVNAFHSDGTSSLYSSVAEAARAYDVTPSSVSAALRGKLSSIRGIIFKYVDEPNCYPAPKPFKFAITDPNTDAQELFFSKNEVARRLNVSHQAIGYALTHGTRCKGFTVTRVG